MLYDTERPVAIAITAMNAARIRCPTAPPPRDARSSGTPSARAALASGPRPTTRRRRGGGLVTVVADDIDYEKKSASPSRSA
jgi:hypothetical protein